MTTSVDLADLASLVQTLVTAIDNFMDQQIQLYTTTDPTVVVSDANGNPVTVPSWAATIGANQQAVSAMQTQVAANTAAIAAIDQGDTTINANITSLQQQQTTNTNNITTLQTQVTAAQGAITTNSGNITTMQGQIEALQTGGTGTNSTLTQLQTQVTQNTNNIASLQTTVTTNTNTLNTLGNTVSTQGTTLSTLQSTVGNNSSSIASLQTGLTTLQTTVTTIGNNQTTDEATLSSLGSTVGTLNNTVTALQTSVTQNTTDIGTLQTNVGALQTSVTANSGAITALQGSLSTMQTSITTNTTDIGNNTTTLNDLTTTVNGLPSVGSYDPQYISARYFTQVFLDANGRVIGGISRKTGKLWLNNGGWLSDRLDQLEAITGNTQTLGFMDNGFYTTFKQPRMPRFQAMIAGAFNSPSDTNTTGIVQFLMGVTPNGDLQTSEGYSVGTRLARLEDIVPDPSKFVARSNRVLITDQGLTGGGGSAWNNILDTSMTVLGASDMSSTQLAALVNRSLILYTATSREYVSGATSVGLTTNSTDLYPLTANSPAGMLKGKLNGFHGTLVRGAEDSDLSFQFDTPPTANYYVTDNAVFEPDGQREMFSGTTIIQIGRNDITNVTSGTQTSVIETIVSNVQAIVDALPCLDKRFVILTPLPYKTEDNTTPQGVALPALELALTAKYPDNTINLRELLQCAYGGSGNDPSSNISAGTLPSSWYDSNGVTFPAPGAAQTYIQNIVWQFLTKKGW